MKTDILLFIVSLEMSETPHLNARDVRLCVANDGPNWLGFAYEII